MQTKGKERDNKIQKTSLNEAHLTYIMPHYYTQYHVHVSVNLFLSLVKIDGHWSDI